MDFFHGDGKDGIVDESGKEASTSLISIKKLDKLHKYH